MPSIAAIRIQTLLWTFLALLFLLSAPILWAASPLVLIVIAAVGAVLGMAVGWVIRSYRHRLGRAALAGAAIACTIIAGPLYWLMLQPALRPLTVPRVTLGDGTRQVVFQGMVHIGSEQFYRSVVYDMIRARDAGYALYFEGTLPGTPEATSWLDAAVHADGDLNAQYARIGQACGMSFQGDFLGFVQEQSAIDPIHIVQADVSVTEMYDEWQRLVADRPELAQAMSAPGPGENSVSLSRVLDIVSGLADRQKEFVATACRGAFTILLNRVEDDDVLNLVVLDFRNRRLAERIAAAPQQDIFITYGSGHFPGLLQQMRKLDPSWKILSTSWSTAILPPDDAVGRLPTTVDP